MTNQLSQIFSARDLGVLVRQVRLTAGLRQVDAAALCGVSAPFLNHLENGKTSARFDSVMKVLRGLGIEISARVPMPLSVQVETRRRVSSTHRVRAKKGAKR